MSDCKHKWCKCPCCEQRYCTSCDAGIEDIRQVEIETLQQSISELEAEARKEDNSHGNTIDQRDRAESWADGLTGLIAEKFDQDFGEHSSMNCPWENAREFLSEFELSKPVGQDIAKQVSIALARQFYGDNSNPTPEQMSCLRVLVYDDEQGELLESVAADIAESMQPPTEEQ